MFREKREQTERDRCAIAASIHLADNDIAVPCLVVDLTERGAGLTLDDTTALPSRFHLALPLMEDLSDQRLVELRWQRGGAAGVAFVRP